MASILLNALASTAGGGLTYLRNVLPRLSQWQKTHQFTALVPHQLNADWLSATCSAVTIVNAPCSSAVGARWWWEQTSLRGMLQQQKYDALISLGNFALLRSPVPQILFSRNELYFSDYFKNDLWQQRAWPMLASHELKSWLARISLRAATCHVTPTAAMAAHLRAAGVSDALMNVLPFGFDPEIFVEQKKPLAVAQAAKLAQQPNALKLLYVSHYNYFRNFETLLRALPLIKELIKERLGRRVQLVLTTELRRGEDYGGYDAARAVELIERLNLSDDLVMLGAVAYDQLSEVYRACDLFVCPSYAESFGHPLLEAMASGLPVIAANLPVHREVCQDAAIYFDVFDESQLAAQAARVLNDEQLRSQLINAGQARVKHFSWDAHVNGLVRLIETVLGGSKQKMSINE